MGRGGLVADSRYTTTSRYVSGQCMQNLIMLIYQPCTPETVWIRRSDKGKAGRDNITGISQDLLWALRKRS